MMEKPIELQKENQTKIAKKESEAAAIAKPLLLVERKNENQIKLSAKTESVEAVVNSNSNSNSKPLIWDCGSSLYDSFELKSFERQLDSAIHSRTLSMPHLSDRRVVNDHPPPPPSHPQPISKKSSKISRSFQKFLRSVFKPAKAQNDSNDIFLPAKQQQQKASQDGVYVVYDKSGILSTIPEVPEFDGLSLSPDVKSLVRRTASDRFTVSSIGISCA